MSEHTECRAKLRALLALVDGAIRDFDGESLRRDAFEAAVRNAQEYMRACGDGNLDLLADEIDRARVGAGGQP